MKKYNFLLILVALILVACARVGNPEGGAKDLTPPTFLRANIDTTRINVPTSLRELRLDFDEYVNLKNISQNLIISPPIKKIKKILPSNLANKYILIRWDENLEENTTYNFNFGNAIVDNNEGNVLPYFNFAFSTGSEIDNLYISGEVKDALALPKQNLKKSVVVGLYRDEADFRQKPQYITKADEDGYFELNYLSKGQYTIIAFEDENENSVYDAGKEKVGFLTEKINLTQSISGKNITIYPSQKPIKYVETKNTTGGMLMIFEGNPEKIEVKSISEELQNYKVSHTPKSDSVMIWVAHNGNALKKETSTPIKLSYITENKQDTISTFFKLNDNENLTLANQKGHSLPPKKEFVISANMDLRQIDTQSWKLTSGNIPQNFEAKISAKKPNEIKIFADFISGKNYALTVPKQSVSSDFYQNDKTYIFNFEIDTPENYGSLVLRLNNTPKTHFWVQLLNQNGDIRYNQYTQNQEIKFTEIVPATYYARIIVDSNENEFWDKANFTENIHAEPVFTFEKPLSIRKLWEIVEDWNLNE